VARHQTLRATVAWSYALLSEAERAVFDRCAVFAGSFDERAAQVICADDAVDAGDIDDVLTSLVDKHMIVADRGGADTRYRLLETMRQYAEAQLGSELETFQTRHLAHYVAVAQELDRLFQGTDLGSGNAGFHRELDNLRAAMQRAIATRDPQAVSLMRATLTFALQTSVPEIGGWFAQVLDALDDPPPYAYGLAAITSFVFELDTERAGALAQAGIDTAASPDDPELADCWCALAMVTFGSGRDGFRGAMDVLERSVPLYRAAGNPVHAVMILSALADFEDGAAAQEWARETRRLAGGLNSQLADVCAAMAEGAAASKAGDAASAVETLRVAYEQLVAADVRGNVRSQLFLRLAVALADRAATATDDAFLAASLRRLQSDGYKLSTAHGLWAAVIYLAATSRLEPAAVVLGHLDGAALPPMDATSSQRADDAIAAQPRLAEWRARGRHLSQDEVFAVAIAALEDHDQ
jgi:hypothetical protein